MDRDHSGPALTDRTYQLAYKCAYQMMRVYWRLRRPTTHGALVTLWNGGEVLLVRNSYVKFYSLPGGYVRRGEDSKDAAVRELREEVGLDAKREDLTLAHDETHTWEGKQDHVEIFEMQVSQRPVVSVDHREVIEAAWWSPDRALQLNLFPPLRKVLERRARA
jgi:ADP-ribose pyrophosphatase YjhB (NUDIX family)